MLRETESLAAGRISVGSPEFDRILTQARMERAEAIADIVVGVSRWVKGLFSGLADVRKRQAAYAELNSLDDRMLRDMGLNRGELWAAVDGMADRGPSNDNQVAATPAVAANENSPKHRAA